jgi:tetratricopeptide (TPR) repeat protein
LHEQGVQAAREGDLETGVAYLQQSLSLGSENIDYMRDYAIVLGWDEQYAEALEQFDRVMAKAPGQPPWARSELARNQLFGGRTESALETLNDLLAEGHSDVATLSRRGLALRWLGRSEEAAATYRRLSKEHPDSSEGVRGLVQSLADRNRLADALDAAADGLETFPGDNDLKIRQVQALNWAGRHLKARRVLDELLPSFQESREGLQQRTLAARWASRPKEAFLLALEYRQKHPEDPQSARLVRDLSLEYGAAVEVDAQGVSDSAGYSYRSTLQQAVLPLSVSHRLSFLRERRDYQDEYADPGSLSWNRFGAGWTGVVGRRVTAHASASTLDYSLAGAGRRTAGEAWASALLTDRITAAGGFGVAPAETLPALRERLMGRALWGEVRLRPVLKVEAGARYTTRSFSGAAERRTAEFSAFRMISQRGGHKIRIGARSQWMWHDRQTPLFWSPDFFHTQLASIRMEGRLSPGVDYAAELGSGIQHEAGYERQYPLVTTVELAKKLHPQLWLRFKAGYSNGSVDRINTGTGAYRFRYFSAGLDFRLGRIG